MAEKFKQRKVVLVINGEAQNYQLYGCWNSIYIPHQAQGIKPSLSKLVCSTYACVCSTAWVRSLISLVTSPLQLVAALRSPFFWAIVPGPAPTNEGHSTRARALPIATVGHLVKHSRLDCQHW